MARVELRETWQVKGSVDSARERVLRFLENRKMTVAENAANELQAKQGSQFLTRLLGGWFVTAKWLPKRARIVIERDGDHARIDAVIEESLGLGIMDPILKGKYEKFFVQWMAELRGEDRDR